MTCGSSLLYFLYSADFGSRLGSLADLRMSTVLGVDCIPIISVDLRLSAYATALCTNIVQQTITAQTYVQCLLVWNGAESGMVLRPRILHMPNPLLWAVAMPGLHQVPMLFNTTAAGTALHALTRYWKTKLLFWVKFSRFDTYTFGVHIRMCYMVDIFVRCICMWNAETYECCMVGWCDERGWIWGSNIRMHIDTRMQGFYFGGQQ